MQYTLVCMSTPYIPIEKKTNKYCLYELNLVFYTHIFSLIWQRLYLFSKIAV